MKAHSFTALLLAIALNPSAHAQVTTLDLAPLYKDVVASNAGVEMVHPFFDFIDNDADGVMDAVGVRFDIYPANSTTRLFGTAKRKVDFPKPCINPDEYQWSELVSVKFLGTDGPRSHVAIGLAGGCTEADEPWEYKEAYSTFVYSAAVDSAAGSVWQAAYYIDLVGFDEVNVDGDPEKELVLGMAIDLPSLPDDASNLRSVGFDAADGTVVFDAKRWLSR
jgi:hypothetical protein